MSTTLSNVPTKATLTIAELKQIAAGGRSTDYKPTIIHFAKSGKTHLDVMEISPFSEKKIDSVFNSFNNNLRVLRAENADWPVIEVKKVVSQEDDTKGMVLLLNMDELNGATEDEDPEPSDED